MANNKLKQIELSNKDIKRLMEWFKVYESNEFDYRLHEWRYEVTDEDDALYEELKELRRSKV